MGIICTLPENADLLDCDLEGENCDGQSNNGAGGD